MKIRIFKADNDVWYYTNINDVYEVAETSEHDYKVVDSFLLIRKNDCILVKE